MEEGGGVQSNRAGEKKEGEGWFHVGGGGGAFKRDA